MRLVIINIKMILHDYNRNFIMQINIRIVLLSNVYQNCNMVVMPMHKLHFVLNLKIVIFNKIDCKNHSITWEIFQGWFELLVL
jgi:hypothetical protein